MKLINLIACTSENLTIGKDNNIPWTVPRDLKYFRNRTINHPVIMGRKTYESIISRLGKPLPKRTNLIISQSLTNVHPDAKLFSNITSAVDYGLTLSNSVFIIGGGEIYKECLPIANRIFLTKLHTDIEGDTKFPLINQEDWANISETHFKADENSPFDLTFITYQRKELK